MNDLRFSLLILALSLAILDLFLTYIYVKRYKKWQPKKPYNLIEMNPLLVFLWNRLGLNLGTIIGSVIIISIIYFIAVYIHIALVILLLLTQLFALVNHNKNINLLDKLIKKYPDGKIPKETFGKVEGSN